MRALSREMLPSVVREAFAYELAPISVAPGSMPAGQIGMREAAFVTGHEEAKLAAARRKGQLVTRICLRANRILPTLDMAEIEWLTDFLANRCGPEVASHELGLPKCAIGQLLAAGLIRTVVHPYVIACYGINQVHRSELARLKHRIVENARPFATITDPISLYRVACNRRRSQAVGADPGRSTERGHGFRRQRGNDQGNLRFDLRCVEAAGDRTGRYAARRPDRSHLAA